MANILNSQVFIVPVASPERIVGGISRTVFCEDSPGFDGSYPPDPPGQRQVEIEASRCAESMGTVTSQDGDLHRAYRLEVRGQVMRRAVRSGMRVVVSLNCLFLLLDYWALPERFEVLFAVRMMWNLTMLAAYVASARADALRATLGSCLLTGAGLIAVIVAAGGMESGYAPGLMLLFLGMPVLLPLSARDAAWVVAVLLLSLIAASIATAGVGGWQQLGVHLFFPAAAALECVASCAALDRMRFADFKQRREIEAARDELSQLDRAKSRFSANVHHELRTPLTLILAPLDLLRTGEMGVLPEGVERALRTMRVNGRRLLKMINNLLDLAKIESREFEIRRRPMELGRLVEEVVEGAAPLAERKRIRVRADGFDRIGTINGDPDALEKVVMNLVGNALKFTDAGGSISVSAMQTDEGGVHFRVADTGIGISPDKIAGIFDRFAQVDNSATRRHEGTGIGLSLAHEMVTLHQGRIWAESEGEGCGTTVHVVLPRGEIDAPEDEEVLSDGSGRVLGLGRSIEAVEAELKLRSDGNTDERFVEMEQTVGRFEGTQAERSVAEPELTSPGLVPGTPEVLIAEDNPDMRELLAMLVGSEYRIRVARDGREALALLRESAPDLVLSDVMMPEMSGTELCRAIKEDEATRAIPVVLVTSKAEREMKIEGLELGADDYVTKPFHPRELLARVRSLVRVRGLQKELAERNRALERALAEIKKAEVQLVQSERLAAVGELAAGIAHEVNNPVNFALNAVRAMKTAVAELRQVADRIVRLDWEDAEHLASQVAEFRRAQEEAGTGELADTLSELAEIAVDGLNRTAGLVGDLRDFAASGAKRAQGRADVDVPKGVESTVHLLKHSLVKAGAEIHLKLPERAPRLRGDAGALNQVFLNLIKNAADALEGRGGVIRVEVSHMRGELQIAVADDGPGMSAEVQERLFEPFFTTKPVGRGTGLGLSISRQIVEAHGGSIDVESELGVGSSVVVHLPIEGAASGSPQAADVEAGGEGCAT